MNVTDRHGQRIRSVVRFRQGRELEQRTNHLLNLHFFSAAVAGDGALHFQWRIFENRKVRFCCGDDGDAPCMSELKSALNVRRVKETLKSRDLGLELPNDVD